MNIRQQFIENMINATVSNRERILTAALQAYSPGVVSFTFNATQGYELLFDIEEQHPFFEPNGEKP